MKVLYIGYYKETGDWARQTINNIKALDRAGVDVVCRNVRLSSNSDRPSEVDYLEDKPIGDADYCIQHVFPDHMVATNKFKKNIGLLMNNFVTLEHSPWEEKLSNMDEVWSPFSGLRTSGLKNTSPLNIIPIDLAVDFDVYKHAYRKLSISRVDDTFKFYTITPSNDLSGLASVISAFHSEFDISENVSLVIQVEPNSGPSVMASIEELSKSIKSKLKLHSDLGSYKKDFISDNQNTSLENIFELHQYCDCYVSSNCMTTFPLSEIDAMFFGNSPIVSDLSSMSTYVDDPIKSIYTISLRDKVTFRDIENGKNFFITRCERELRDKMRERFESHNSGTKSNNKKLAALKCADLSLEKQGQKMKELLIV